MGVSTVTIGILPTYETIGIAAPALLALCRFGQGLGLGGEWGGAVLLAVENAPPGNERGTGCFRSSGRRSGFSFRAARSWRCRNGSPTISSSPSAGASRSSRAQRSWRVGLYVRLTITETPVFQQAAMREERAKVPMLAVIREHPRTLVLGTLASIETFVLFYLMTVFALSWGTSVLGYSRNTFLVIQLIGIVFFALAIPVSAVIAERGRRSTLIWVTVAIGVFGLVMAPLLPSGLVGATIAMVIGLSLMGLTYGPLGTTLSELFPTRVRYTGSSLTFNLAGIFGASLAPYIATWLAQNYGLQYVGYYVVGGRGPDARRPAGDRRDQGSATVSAVNSQFPTPNCQVELLTHNGLGVGSWIWELFRRKSPFRGEPSACASLNTSRSSWHPIETADRGSLARDLDRNLRSAERVGRDNDARTAGLKTRRYVSESRTVHSPKRCSSVQPVQKVSEIKSARRTNT